MKKIQSFAAAAVLTLAFSAAAAAQTVSTAPAGSPQGGYVPINPNGSARAPITQDVVDEIAYNIGVQLVYPRARKGFTAAENPSTGDRVGLQFTLHGNDQATVSHVYDLNDYGDGNRYNAALHNAQRTEDALAAREYRRSTVYVPGPVIVTPRRSPTIDIDIIVGRRPYPGRRYEPYRYPQQRPVIIVRPPPVSRPAPVIIYDNSRNTRGRDIYNDRARDRDSRDRSPGRDGTRDRDNDGGYRRAQPRDDGGEQRRAVPREQNNEGGARDRTPPREERHAIPRPRR